MAALPPIVQPPRPAGYVRDHLSPASDESIEIIQGNSSQPSAQRTDHEGRVLAEIVTIEDRMHHVSMPTARVPIEVAKQLVKVNMDVEPFEEPVTVKPLFTRGQIIVLVVLCVVAVALIIVGSLLEKLAS